MHLSISILFIPVVLLSVATLLLLQVQALDKSYRIPSIHSNLVIGHNKCTATATEHMTFEFTGHFSTIGRYFPSVDGTLPKISNYKVHSPNVHISKTYLLDDQSGSGRYLVWDFVTMNSSLPEQVSIVNFELAFSIDGIFRGFSPKYMTLLYSYKWNAPVDRISANVSIAVASNRTTTTTQDEVIWSPKNNAQYELTSDGRAHLSFLQPASLLANEPYYIVVDLPVKMGKNWGKCNDKRKLRKRKIVTGVLCSVSGVIGLILLCLFFYAVAHYSKKNEGNTSSTSTSSTGRSNHHGAWTNHVRIHVSGPGSRSVVSGGGVSGSSGFAR